MPKVAGKKYAYDKAGKKQAEQARKKLKGKGGKK
tara:strand:+ start:772 stop:873 length:102 start_codon:yes stop_codon:yes gene_type:complete